MNEAAIYQHLDSIQGKRVPVYVCSIDLEQHFPYRGICWLVHMLVMSFGGDPISNHITPSNVATKVHLAQVSATAVHNLGVLHKDLEPRNILWNPQTKTVMIIDFERAKLVKAPRPALGTISHNPRNGKNPVTTDPKFAKESAEEIYHMDSALKYLAS
jgi:serine/threonine protein kinase